MSGFISLHRKVQEWAWYQDSETFHLFCHLLLRANHKPSQWLGTTIERGQLATGVNALSVQTGITPKKVRVRLKRLEKSGEITRKWASKYSLVTICNYESYQGTTPAKGQAKGKQRASKGQHLNNNNNNNKEKTIDQNELTFDLFWAEYPKKVAKEKAKKIWMSRKLGEKFFERIMEGLSSQKNSESWLEKRYIPHPPTWLHNSRWNDEVETISQERCPVCDYYNGGKCKNLSKENFEPDKCGGFRKMAN